MCVVCALTPEQDSTDANGDSWRGAKQSGTAKTQKPLPVLQSIAFFCIILPPWSWFHFCHMNRYFFVCIFACSSWEARETNYSECANKQWNLWGRTQFIFWISETFRPIQSFSRSCPHLAQGGAGTDHVWSWTKYRDAHLRHAAFWSSLHTPDSLMRLQATPSWWLKITHQRKKTPTHPKTNKHSTQRCHGAWHYIELTWL